MQVTHEDRCIGALLGTACGDILGAAVEGWSARSIRERFGQVRDFVDTVRGFGCYTDDTQMTLALAASLVERGRVDAEHVSGKYAEFYESARGYGSATDRVMRALRSGADYRGTGVLKFPEGSCGNGGAMRIAPVGLSYRNAPDGVLHRAVEAALLCTHVHPEAIDGAFLQAKAIALAATADDSGHFDRRQFVDLLLHAARTPILQSKLEALAAGLRDGDEDIFVIARVGNGIRASEAVAAALWAFVRYGDAPEECLIGAVGFGGDTDTVGAMTGALLGSLHGSNWIPRRWYDNVENGRLGRDAIVRVAQELADLDVVAESPAAT